VARISAKVRSAVVSVRTSGVFDTGIRRWVATFPKEHNTKWIKIPLQRYQF
jgi:hypothetical protein